MQEQKVTIYLAKIESDLNYLISIVLDTNNKSRESAAYTLGCIKTNFNFIKDLLLDEPPITTEPVDKLKDLVNLDWILKLDLNLFTSKFTIIHYAVSNELITKNNYPNFLGEVAKIVSKDTGIDASTWSAISLFNYIDDTDRGYLDNEEEEDIEDYYCSNSLKTIIHQYFLDIEIKSFADKLTKIQKY